MHATILVAGPIETSEVAVGFATGIAEKVRHAAMPAISRVGSAVSHVRYACDGRGTETNRPRLLSVHSEEVEDYSPRRATDSTREGSFRARDLLEGGLSRVYEGQRETDDIDFSSCSALPPSQSLGELASSESGETDGDWSRMTARSSLAKFTSSRLRLALTPRRFSAGPTVRTDATGGAPVTISAGVSTSEDGGVSSPSSSRSAATPALKKV